MPQISPQAAELLDKVLALSIEDRGLITGRLIKSLDEGPVEEGVEAAWSDEIKRRVEEIESGKVKTIPGEQVFRELEQEFPDER